MNINNYIAYIYKPCIIYVYMYMCVYIHIYVYIYLSLYVYIYIENESPYIIEHGFGRKADLNPIPGSAVYLLSLSYF